MMRKVCNSLCKYHIHILCGIGHDNFTKCEMVHNIFTSSAIVLTPLVECIKVYSGFWIFFTDACRVMIEINTSSRDLFTAV